MPLKNKVVLVVDDEPELRELLRDEFEAQGCLVLEAENGTSALKLVEQQPIHAVVSDVRMAGGDGIALLKSVREREQELPVVCLITGHSEVTHSEVVAMGGLALIHKPYAMHKVVEVISKGLEQIDVSLREAA